VILLSIGITFHVSAAEVTKIAVLEFELNDITSLPNTADEIIRTASFKPLLESAIRNLGEYKIMQINAKDYALENAGFGYLYKFHDSAASLGEKIGAEWIIIGQHSKPSFLYSYIMANVVNVKTKQLIAHYDIELKGSHRKVTDRGIKAIAKKITNKIKQYQP
jgi:hypothetical protein